MDAPKLYKLAWFITFFLVIAGCKQIDNQPVPVVPKIPESTIQAIAGADQVDTVGAKLLDSIVIKINEPGSGLNKYFVKIFQKTLCNGDSVTQKVVFNGKTISYKWSLGSSPGVQQLKFTVLDSTKKIIDSILVTATAIPPAHGWHASSCLVKTDLFVNTFAKTNTGRILAGFSGNFFPYYSDDNGISWHPISSFYFAGYYPWVEKIIVLPTDEIFIGSELNGLFYSVDNGITWGNRSRGLPPIIAFHDFAYIPDGKLIFTSSNGGIYLSEDKGNNWLTIQPDDKYDGRAYKYQAMQSNGDIYLLQSANLVNTLVVLDHLTQNLSIVTNLPAILLNAFFIDKNNNMYVGGLNLTNNSAEIYQSSDNGNSWVNVFSYKEASPTIANISTQSDGNTYFEVLGKNIYYYKTPDFKSFDKIPDLNNSYSGQYILAANNYFVTTGFPLTLWYYVQ